MSLLDAVKAHLATEGFAIGIGARPDGTDDGRPYAILYSPSTVFDGDVQVVDDERDQLIHVKTFGRLWGQVGDIDGNGLAGRLDRRLRDGLLEVPGAVVQGLQREQVTGPTRDTDTHPDPPIFHADAYYRVWLAPDPT